jgi:hypothetical protein
LAISAEYDKYSSAYLNRATNPPKKCSNCNTTFYRKEKERKKDFEERDYCTEECRRILIGFNRNTKKEYDYKIAEPDLRTCGNCRYMHEDDEIGDHCVPCKNGKNFILKTKRG